MGIRLLLAARAIGGCLSALTPGECTAHEIPDTAHEECAEHILKWYKWIMDTQQHGGQLQGSIGSACLN